MAKTSKGQNTPPGPAVDATGQTVIDPTENVKAILQAAVSRLDDLRSAEQRRITDLESERNHYMEMASRNESDALARDRAAIREVATLRAKYDDKLRTAEAARIDAIRSVDQQNVQQAATVSATQATTLAAQVATSADTLRNQVAAAATASTVALAAALDPIQKDIADLRRAQYEAQGQKTQVVETQGERGGQRQSVGLWIAAAAVVVTIVVAITGVIVAMLVQNPTP